MPVCGQSSVKRVTLNLQNAEMEEFIRQIKTQTGFTFFYNDKLLPKLEPVTVRKNNAPLEEVLRQVLEPKDRGDDHRYPRKLGREKTGNTGACGRRDG